MASNNFTIDIGDGPFAQSVIALARATLFWSMSNFIVRIVTELLGFWLLSIPIILASVEASPDAVQSLKKSDHDQQDLPFQSEEKLQVAIQEVTASQPEVSPKSRAITASLRRTLLFWIKLHGKLGSITHSIGFVAIFILVGNATDMMDEAAADMMTGLAIYQSPPRYLSQWIIKNGPRVLLRLTCDLLMIPLSLTWVWHVLSLNSPNRRSLVNWPFLQRLVAVPGLWSFLKRIDLPTLPSKRAIRFMVVPSLIQFALSDLWDLYPSSIIHLIFVDSLGDGARPNTLVAMAIILEQCLKFVASHVLPVVANSVAIRVESSLLPDGALPIIHFDRAYGLKTKHGEGLTMAEAWTTMSWDELLRIVTVHIKTLVLFFIILVPVTIYGIMSNMLEALANGQQDQHGEL